MPLVDIGSFPRTDFGNISVSGANATATLRAKPMSSACPTIPTAAGTTAVTLIAPFAGTLTAARFVAKDALATHATNILSWLIKNKGQAGAGTTDMLATTAVNSTNATGGTALAAYTTRALTVHPTAANLLVAAGDCLELQATGAGTLANTVTEGYWQLLFDATA